MKIAVWDTYVTKKDGTIMHFDIFVPDTLKDEVKIFNFGKEYLKSKNQINQTLTSNECRFCHIEQAPTHVIKEIEQKGYYIYEMENCN
jgi:hypothetical protein